LSTIVVAYDGRKAGTGSKQTTYTYTGASTIMSVASNMSNLDRNAVIENLVIDGTNASGTTGILLENVCNCLIRNLTIRNCTVGIEVKITGNNRAFGNRFEHIRMINVKTGIRFTGTSSNKDFAYTSIDDVGISLCVDVFDQYPANYNGIYVGSNARLYNAFVKATLWTSDDYLHRGLVVDGELRYSLVNVEVENSGCGVLIGLGGVVLDNQSFLLTTLALDQNKRVDNKNGYGHDIVVAFQDGV